ncbi:MAG: helix-turn-helix domain-containing protein [Proteobacteria bacterium]|nr:helix-turn-helix domain-containing protein [Pseudomonadota bacterium]
MRSRIHELNRVRVEVAKALAHETRLLFIDALKERGRSIEDLAFLAEIETDTASRHLAALLRAGLVEEPSPDGPPLWHLKTAFLIASMELMIGRPIISETRRARPRRVRAGFFDKYCQGSGIDVGFGGDVLADNCQGWDVEDGDAQLLAAIPDNRFDFVYSSHTLEDLDRPDVALINWWRVIRPGGYLIIYLPHRDLYEKKTRLPSRWNPDHRRFFLLDRDDPPDTLGLIPLIERTLSGYDLLEAAVRDEGHTIDDPDVHSDGEYSMEVVLRKHPD